MSSSTQPTPDEPDWDRVRGEFASAPGVVYLNTGSYGRIPNPVLKKAAELRARLTADPCDMLWRQLPDLLWAARDRLARFVGAPAETILFTANVTAGVNMVASGLALSRARDIVLNDQEYGAMTYAWQRTADRAGAGVRTIELPIGPDFTRQDVLDRFERAIDARAQLVFLSHITTATGLVLPVREICELARGRGVISVVDGAHAPGMIPVNLSELGCDFYAANCHKWLLAPIGSGFLYTRPGLEERLEPLIVSWGWKRDRARALERDQEGSTPYIRAHEFQGTRDPSPWLATGAAIDFHEALGRDRVLARDRELAAYARSALRAGTRAEATLPDDAALSAALAAYRVPPCDPATLARRLWEQYHIEAPVLDRPGGPYVRVSTHFYNTTHEIDRLVAALAELFG